MYNQNHLPEKSKQLVVLRGLCVCVCVCVCVCDGGGELSMSVCQVSSTQTVPYNHWGWIYSKLLQVGGGEISNVCMSVCLSVKFLPQKLSHTTTGTGFTLNYCKFVFLRKKKDFCPCVWLWTNLSTTPPPPL